MNEGEPEITELLNRAAKGDADAVRDVFPAIYRELRSLASSKLSRVPPGGTLQTTALVHEAYLRVAGRHSEGWESARHFYFTAARAMRDILVEEARRKASEKRGGGRERVPLEEITLTIDGAPEEMLALDAALTKLEKEDPEGHKLVMLRFFTGLTVAGVRGNAGDFGAHRGASLAIPSRVARARSGSVRAQR